MKHHNIWIAILCGLLLSVTGSHAADYTVPAPTGNPVTDTANVNAALTSALADAGPNRVLFQSGGTYVLTATLTVAGDVKNVTFTTTGAGRATLVSPNYTPNPTLLGNSRPYEGLFSCGVTNSQIGWDNLIILPAPFSVTGATGAVGNTLAIGISPLSTTTTFRFNNLLITANDNTNNPVATNGLRTPGDLVPVNWTMFGVGCVFVGAQSNIEAVPGGADNEFYFDNFVGSLAGQAIFWSGRTSTDLLRHQCGEVWEARNSVFSYAAGWTGPAFGGGSTLEDLMIDGIANVRLYNCYVDSWWFTGSSRETFRIMDAEKVWLQNCHVNQSGIGKRYAFVTDSVSDNVDIVDCTFTNGRSFLIHTRGLQFANQVFSCTRVYCANGNLAGGADVEAIDLTGSDGANSGPGEVYMNNVTVENVLGGIGVQLAASTRRGVFENCTFRNIADSAIFTNVTTTGIAGATLEVRNCVIEDCPIAPGNVTQRAAAICSRMGYTVVENCNIRVGGAVDVNADTGILTEDVMNVVIRNTTVSNANEAGIWLADMRVYNEVAANLRPAVGVLIEDCTLIDCGRFINAAKGTPWTDLLTNAFRIAAMVVDDGGNNTIRNCRIENSFADAMYLFWDTATSGSTLVENIDFVNCRNNLVTLFALNPSTNSTSATLRNLTVDRAAVSIVPETDDDAARTVVDRDPPAFYVRAATVEIADVTVLNNGSTAISAGFAGSSPGVHRVHDVVIRDVTANGLEVLGGRGNLLSNIEVINAVSAGITLGKVGVGAGLSVAALDDLCLVGNGVNLQIKQGDNTQPPMALTNSTLLDSPVGISYETLQGQVLQATDCIIGGANPGGVGIDIPVLVVDTFSGINPPRVQVFTSALIAEGDWALAFPTQVSPLNPAGTITLSGIVTADPVFASTTPGEANFLAVRSTAYGNQATGIGAGQTTDLDGCSYYIGDWVAILGWRAF
ncbi:right-handed parallel beta-helix repeat-containing protein [bacterium]|nr:right-handed parallel beta-helix repeat-containing protein [bacterium]